MKSLCRLAVSLLVAALFVAAFGQGKDPTAVLKSISELRTQRSAEARQAGKQLDINALNAEIAQKVNDAIKDVNPNGVESSKAYAWAQLFSMAGKHKDACDLTVRYIHENPEASDKFAAQMLMLNSCNALGEGDMLDARLRDVVPKDTLSSQALVRTLCNSWAATIAKSKGVEAAINAIEYGAKSLKYEMPDAYAERLFVATKSRNPKNQDGTDMTDEQINVMLRAQGKSVNDGLDYTIMSSKANLLLEAGRKAEAVQLYDAFIIAKGAATSYGRRAASSKTQITMIGQPFTELKFDRKLGEFTSLESWKGKVVIIDFTAHW